MKLKKKILSLIAVVMVTVMAFSVPAMAAGTETWNGNWVTEPVMVITNNNLTPVKTMGRDGTLHVAAGIKGRPDLEKETKLKGTRFTKKKIKAPMKISA